MLTFTVQCSVTHNLVNTAASGKVIPLYANSTGPDSDMYALKARDKLHKREKVEYKERKRGDQGRAREVDAYHRGETSHDSRVADRRQPATTKREAKVFATVCWESECVCVCVGGGGGGGGGGDLVLKELSCQC